MSGKIYELYDYEYPYLTEYTEFKSKGGTGRKLDYKSDNYTEHRQQVLYRAKRDLKRLINSNVGMYGEKYISKFLTITFADNITDLNQAHYEWEKFIKRLNYNVFKSKKAQLKYNVVIEFQERGAVHYHVIIYNMPYVRQPDLVELWGNGHQVDIRKIEDVDNVGAYISGYLGDPQKDQGKDKEDSRLQGRKSYFSSRGLYKPIELIDKKMVEAVLATLPKEKITYSNTFTNEYKGNVSYKQYTLGDK